MLTLRQVAQGSERVERRAEAATREAQAEPFLRRLLGHFARLFGSLRRSTTLRGPLLSFNSVCKAWGPRFESGRRLSGSVRGGRQDVLAELVQPPSPPSYQRRGKAFTAQP